MSAPHCGTIHYQNPRIIAGCVPDHEGRVLLCRRAIEPRLGYWTFPAGFMENRETVQQAAARESLEEAQAHVQIGSLLAVVHVLEANQVHMFFRAILPRAEFGISPESLEVGSVRGNMTSRGGKLPFPASNSHCASTLPTAPPAARTTISPPPSAAPGCERASRTGAVRGRITGSDASDTRASHLCRG